MIETRIAPSPTGLFHIGTARTALINYIFAKQNKGEFLLRMEDTDKERNKPEYEEDIKNGLKWLGLVWDGEIVYQKNRFDRYLEIVSELVKKENAYEKDGAIWLKIPPGKVKFQDLIRGEVEFDSKDLKDFVILRSDKSPIFYLSGVVDDHDSQITHVIRGEEHLSNTPKQILLLQALGWEIPIYAHVPLILNQDRSKMSKRKDPVSVTRDFKQKGCLHDAMINYLFLLGFHPTEKELKVESQKSKVETDVYNLSEMVEKFDISRMQKGGAIFDQTKLDDINHHYIMSKTDEEYLGEISSFMPKGIDQEKFKKLAVISRERIKKYQDIENELIWLKDLSPYNGELLIFRKSDLDKTKKSLRLLFEQLQNLSDEPQDSKTYHLLMHKVMETGKLDKGDVFWSARVALAGTKQSPPPEDLMWLLGKQETINRIANAIDKINH